jgi:hypothetical protein
MSELDNSETLRRKARDFRTQAEETNQAIYKEKLLTLADLYEVRAQLYEENEALRRATS